MYTQAIKDRKEKILSVTSVFETSRLMPHYDVITILRDGPKDQNGKKRLQITYGKHQTTEFGNLKALIRMYIDSYGRYAREFRPYLSQIGVTPLCTNKPFLYLLKMAGTDYIMHEVQDRFFDQYYWNPAYQFFLRNGFQLPLSMLVIYDSYIHSGGIPAWLRDDFSEVPPVKGGEEKAWTAAYVEARDLWLENHSDKVLRNTDYRTDCFIEAIEQGNWDLSKPLICKFNLEDKDGDGYESGWITIP